MKFVFTADEVAGALQLELAEFERLRPDLERIGFPKPIVGLESRWAIMDVINWVNRANAATSLKPGQSIADVFKKPIPYPDRIPLRVVSNN